MERTGFYDIISGRSRGLLPALCRWLLRITELAYGLVIRFRNHCYDHGRFKTYRVDVPVISIGNLTTGGTGKTPMVEWLARWFLTRAVGVSIVSRGYGAQRGSPNDEALELEQKLPDVPHLQDPDRVAAAQVAVKELQTQLILLDDAFQHRRIHRDLDIVLVDSLQPFGYGHLLLRGLLREPLSSLKRANVVALTRSDMINAEQRSEIRQTVSQFAPQATWIELAHRPQVLRSSSGKTRNISSLRGWRVAAFCGIGNPSGFRHTLADCGFVVVGFRQFPDHHRYDPKDIKSLADWTEQLDGIAAIVCTHKDLVKIGVERIGENEMWALTIGMEILSGKEALESHLAALVPLG